MEAGIAVLTAFEVLQEDAADGQVDWKKQATGLFGDVKASFLSSLLFLRFRPCWSTKSFKMCREKWAEPKSQLTPLLSNLSSVILVPLEI